MLGKIPLKNQRQMRLRNIFYCVFCLWLFCLCCMRLVLPFFVRVLCFFQLWLWICFPSRGLSTIPKCNRQRQEFGTSSSTMCLISVRVGPTWFQETYWNLLLLSARNQDLKVGRSTCQCLWDWRHQFQRHRHTKQPSCLPCKEMDQTWTVWIHTSWTFQGSSEPDSRTIATTI